MEIFFKNETSIPNKLDTHKNDNQQDIVNELHGLHESFSLAKNKNSCNLCNSWINNEAHLFRSLVLRTEIGYAARLLWGAGQEEGFLMAPVFL